MKLKLKIKNIVAVLYVLFALWSLNPYFTWQSYVGGAFGYINGSIPVRSVFALLASIMGVYYIVVTKKKSEMSEMGVLIIICAIVLLGVCGGLGSNIFNTTWISFIAIAIFLFLPISLQKVTFDIFVTLFTVTLIPSLIFYLFALIGVNLPYSVLLPYETIKINGGIYYQHRLFSALIINPAVSLNRFNGIYYEAGILGTMISMILGIKKYGFNGKEKWREKILFVAGILTMSLAFILLTAIFFLSKSIAEHKVKNAISLTIIIIGYLVFVSVPFSNATLANIQNRITIVDNSLQGDNRVSRGYERAMEEYYNADLKTKLFGYGRGTFGRLQGVSGFDGSSYKSILFDYGYVGFLLCISWFIFYGVRSFRKFKIPMVALFPVIIVQLANMYQNPAVFPIYFMLIFIGGIAELAQEEKRNVKII